MKRSDVEKLPWQDADSSNVRRVAFVQTGTVDDFLGDDGPTAVGILYVQFHGNEKLYAYGELPEEKATALIAAESVGAYLNAEIKGVHPYEIVEFEPEPPGPPAPPKPAGHRPVG